MARLLPNADHRRMPWKNGGGETVEVIVHPEGASLSDFGWRVSMASVASDGPFSVFPGIDRTLAVLSGDGMALSIEGLGDRLLTPQSAPHQLRWGVRLTVSGRPTGLSAGAADAQRTLRLCAHTGSREHDA